MWAMEGLIPGRGKKFLSSPKCPDCLWCPPSLLCNEYQEFSTLGGTVAAACR